MYVPLNLNLLLLLLSASTSASTSASLKEIGLHVLESLVRVIVEINGFNGLNRLNGLNTFYLLLALSLAFVFIYIYEYGRAEEAGFATLGADFGDKGKGGNLLILNKSINETRGIKRS